MNRFLYNILLVLLLGFSLPMMGQHHRHTPRTQLLQQAKKAAEPMVATTDTTRLDTTVVDTAASKITRLNAEDHWSDGSYRVNTPFDEISKLNESYTGTVFNIVIIIAIVFILIAPLFLLAIIFWMGYNLRRNKQKIIELALIHNKPIPEPYLSPKKQIDKAYFVRACTSFFAGLGIILFGLVLDASFFIAIGAFVCCYGLGRVCIFLFFNRKDKNF